MTSNDVNFFYRSTILQPQQSSGLKFLHLSSHLTQLNEKIRCYTNHTNLTLHKPQLHQTSTCPPKTHTKAETSTIWPKMAQKSPTTPAKWESSPPSPAPIKWTKRTTKASATQICKPLQTTPSTLPAQAMTRVPLVRSSLEQEINYRQTLRARDPEGYTDDGADLAPGSGYGEEGCLIDMLVGYISGDVGCRRPKGKRFAPRLVFIHTAILFKNTEINSSESLAPPDFARSAEHSSSIHLPQSQWNRFRMLPLSVLATLMIPSRQACSFHSSIFILSLYPWKQRKTGNPHVSSAKYGLALDPYFVDFFLSLTFSLSSSRFHCSNPFSLITLHPSNLRPFSLPHAGSPDNSF